MARVEVPGTLYHYTSLNALACILHYGTFRFTRLDMLNDPAEYDPDDRRDAYKAVFVSAWTAHQEDTIPMWRMYTNDMAGVRLRLPSTLFNRNGKVQTFAVSGFNHHGSEIIKSTEIVREFRTADTLIERQFSPRHVVGPDPMYYYIDEECARPGLKVAANGDQAVLPLRQPIGLGWRKHEAWKYENEWRFRLFCDDVAGPESPTEIGDCIDYRRNPILTKHVDVTFSDEVLSHAEFMLGPAAGKAEALILDALAEKYAPEATIKRSRIRVATADSDRSF